MQNGETPAIWNSGPWTSEFEFLTKLGEGGQGYTFRAQRKSDGLIVALKRLRPDRDTPKSRRRMLREVTALRTLSQTNALVPHFVDSNIDEAIDRNDLKPFVAMEFIDGNTLLAAQKSKGILNIESAIEFTKKLLKTIEIAHAEDTAHRDIKPQNIVLRSDSYDSPYVIDFGLSFNQIIDHEEDLTSIRESIGNRFLTLHESESTGSDSKHDFKSDLTLAIGVFFFLLTDKFPEYVSADSAKSPHRRYQDILTAKHGDAVVFLNSFFDRGFQYNVANRYDSVSEVCERLKQLGARVMGELPAVDPIAVAREMKQRLTTENRSFQLDELEMKHKTNLANFQKYLVGVAKNKELSPIALHVDSQQFGNRLLESREVIRNSLLFVKLTIKHHVSQCYCRYFMAIKGEEITVCFQEVLETDPKRIRQIQDILQKQPILELLHFFDWDESYTEQLTRHFGNWFERTSHSIIAKP